MNIVWCNINRFLAKDLDNIYSISKDLVFPPTTTERTGLNINIFNFAAESILDFSNTYNTFTLQLRPHTKVSLLTAYVLCDPRYSIFSDLLPKRSSIRDPASLLCLVGAEAPCRANSDLASPNKQLARRIFVRFLMSRQENNHNMHLRVAILSMLSEYVSQNIVDLLCTEEYTDGFADLLYEKPTKVPVFPKNFDSNILYCVPLFQFNMSIALAYKAKKNIPTIRLTLTTYNTNTTDTINIDKTHLKTLFCTSDCRLAKMSNSRVGGVELVATIPYFVDIFNEEDWTVLYGLLLSLSFTGRLMHTKPLGKLPENIKTAICCTLSLCEKSILPFFVVVDGGSERPGGIEFIRRNGFFLNDIPGATNSNRSITLEDDSIYILELRSVDIVSVELIITGVEETGTSIMYKNATTYGTKNTGNPDVLSLGNLSKRNGTTRERHRLEVGKLVVLVKDKLTIKLTKIVKKDNTPNKDIILDQ